MTSSPSFRRELPTSRVAGENLHGLEFPPRPEGILSFMLSHLTLRMQVCMKQYAIRPVSLLSASGHCNMLVEPINFSFAFISSLAKGEFPLAYVKHRMVNTLLSGGRNRGDVSLVKLLAKSIPENGRLVYTPVTISLA